MSNQVAPANLVGFVAQSMYAPIPLKVKFAKISASATEQDVVAAVSGKRIRVLSAQFTLTGHLDATAQFFSNGSGGTAISGLFKPLALQTDSGGAAMIVLSAADHPYGCFETATGQKLTVDGTGTSAPAIEGFLTYVEVDPNINQ